MSTTSCVPGCGFRPSSTGPTAAGRASTRRRRADVGVGPWRRHTRARVGVGEVEGGAVRRRREDVALRAPRSAPSRRSGSPRARERARPRPPPRAWPPRPRRVVDVGSGRERRAPERHRALRVELGGALERADRLLVVEAEAVEQPLVEEPLRLRVARVTGRWKGRGRRRARRRAAAPARRMRTDRRSSPSIRCRGMRRPARLADEQRRATTPAIDHGPSLLSRVPSLRTSTEGGASKARERGRGIPPHPNMRVTGATRGRAGVVGATRSSSVATHAETSGSSSVRSGSPEVPNASTSTSILCATTGQPRASASWTGKPKPSQRLGKTSAAARARRVAVAASSSGPAKTTRRARSSSFIFARSAASPGPEPTSTSRARASAPSRGARASAARTRSSPLRGSRWPTASRNGASATPSRASSAAAAASSSKTAASPSVAFATTCTRSAGTRKRATILRA